MKPDTVNIVSGLPRSGTSMMMQVLVAGGIPALTDHVRKPDKDNPKGYYELEMVKQIGKDASFLDQAYGKVIKVIYLLLYHLPMDRSYRVVFMQRKMEEVVASQRNMLIRLGITRRECSWLQLCRIFQRQLEDVMVWLHQQDNIRLLCVNYNEALGNPGALADALNRFWEGSLDTGGMIRAVDPTLYHRRNDACFRRVLTDDFARS